MNTSKSFTTVSDCTRRLTTKHQLTTKQVLINVLKPESVFRGEDHIRDAEEFQKKNLAMDNDIASPVINIPKEALLTTRDLETLLKSNNIEKSSILLIVSSDTKDAKKVADHLQQNQYGQVLYYENDYN